MAKVEATLAVENMQSTAEGAAAEEAMVPMVLAVAVVARYMRQAAAEVAAETTVLGQVVMEGSGENTHLVQVSATGHLLEAAQEVTLLQVEPLVQVEDMDVATVEAAEEQILMAQTPQGQVVQVVRLEAAEVVAVEAL